MELAKQKTVDEYETYADYSESRSDAGKGVLPESLFNTLKAIPNSCFREIK